MKLLCYVVLVGIMVSCNSFETKKVSPQTMINQELKTFNWNQVDTYPAFKVCDSLVRKNDHQACFEKVIITVISDYLNTKNYQVSKTVFDTVFVKFEVHKTGETKFITLEQDSLTQAVLPELKADIEFSLTRLPKLEPAIKRGQFVNTQFKLPVIIAVN